MKISVLISIFIIIILFPFSSVFAGSVNNCIAIVDDVGRKVRIEKYPERIVSLAPSNTEILFALGLGDKVVGVTAYCNFPPDVETKERIGGFSNPDIEKIIALSPDLLVADSMCYRQGIVDKLEQRGLRTIVLAPETLTGVLHTMRMVGAATGKHREAARLVADMEGRIGAVAERIRTIERIKRPKVLFITWHDPLWVAGSGILIHDLIEQAGGVNVAADTEAWKILDLEEVLMRNPSVIIVNCGHGKAKRSPFAWTRNEPRLGNVDARRSGRVYDIDADLSGRFGPRIVDVLEQLAVYFHAEICGMDNAN